MLSSWAGAQSMASLTRLKSPMMKSGCRCLVLLSSSLQKVGCSFGLFGAYKLSMDIFLFPCHLVVSRIA